MIIRTQVMFLLLFLLAGCTSKPFKYDELSFGEFSSIIFSNETYVAMQQPCKSFNLREQNNWLFAVISRWQAKTGFARGHGITCWPLPMPTETMPRKPRSRR